jgi:hypothetical protein
LSGDGPDGGQQQGNDKELGGNGHVISPSDPNSVDKAAFRRAKEPFVTDAGEASSSESRTTARLGRSRTLSNFPPVYGFSSDHHFLCSQF